jgi:alpha-L-rhamnosidase
MGDTNTPGYKHFFLQPHPGGGLTSASAKLETPYGGIRSEWNIKKGKLQYRCSIPPNTTGTICFEHAEAKNILLNELPLENNPAIHCSKSNGNVKIEAGSGEYKFTVSGIFN